MFGAHRVLEKSGHPRRIYLTQSALVDEASREAVDVTGAKLDEILKVEGAKKP
jgi:hypothetical protein